MTTPRRQYLAARRRVRNFPKPHLVMRNGLWQCSARDAVPTLSRMQFYGAEGCGVWGERAYGMAPAPYRAWLYWTAPAINDRENISRSTA